jgi:hypothetical protein
VILVQSCDVSKQKLFINSYLASVKHISVKIASGDCQVETSFRHEIMSEVVNGNLPIPEKLGDIRDQFLKGNSPGGTGLSFLH